VISPAAILVAASALLVIPPVSSAVSSSASSSAGAVGRSESARERGARSITADALLADVTWLAAPERDGRLPGTEGYAAAARWCADRFAALGLEPAGDADYCQELTLECNRILGAPRLRVSTAAGGVHGAVLGEDFLCRGFTGAGRIAAPVTFVGYGVSLPERGHDDYAGCDVRSRAILCLKPAPTWPAADGEEWGWATRGPRQKAAWAAAHGAVALLWVNPATNPRFPAQPIASVMHGPGEQDPDFPQLEISVELADRLLGGPGALQAAQAGIDSTRSPASRDLAARVEIDVRTAYESAAAACNIVALLPGADPRLRDEVLVLGAHLDHVGRQSSDLYLPGANDNASGAAAVLALARAFATAERRPARTVVFALFAGEEQGLLGARHYVEHPAAPLERTVAMFNLDCVAHGDSIKIGSGESSPELWQWARAIDAEHAALTVAATWAGGGADATPFHEAGVKTLYWVTTNSYAHLHRPTDTPATLNGPLFEALVRLAFRTAWEVADAGAGTGAAAGSAAGTGAVEGEI
jgi:hypothetical protein